MVITAAINIAIQHGTITAIAYTAALFVLSGLESAGPGCPESYVLGVSKISTKTLI